METTAKKPQTWGFVMIRHVCSKATDLYWKESYACIRKWYPHIPVVIVDDHSRPEYLTENIVLTNCTVIYDQGIHKGAAEWLAYYYFHHLHPFDVAVILHDSVFLQSAVDFSLDADEPVRFLWSFPSYYDAEIREWIRALVASLPHGAAHMDRFDQPDTWQRCFGVMSVIRWDTLDALDEREGGVLSHWASLIHSRDQRHALERAFSLLMEPKKPALFGDIYAYLPWGTTFVDYLTQPERFADRPVMKVWTAR